MYQVPMVKGHKNAAEWGGEGGGDRC